MECKGTGCKSGKCKKPCDEISQQVFEEMVVHEGKIVEETQPRPESEQKHMEMISHEKLHKIQSKMWKEAENETLSSKS